MKITPFGLQLMNFEQTGQLLAVPKEALDEDPQDLLERVDYCFKATRDEDTTGATTVRFIGTSSNGVAGKLLRPISMRKRANAAWIASTRPTAGARTFRSARPLN